MFLNRVAILTKESVVSQSERQEKKEYVQEHAHIWAMHGVTYCTIRRRYTPTPSTDSLKSTSLLGWLKTCPEDLAKHAGAFLLMAAR